MFVLGVVVTLSLGIGMTTAILSLADATLLTCDWLTPAQYQDAAAFARLAKSARLCRTWGDATATCSSPPAGPTSWSTPS